MKFNLKVGDLFTPVSHHIFNVVIEVTREDVYFYTIRTNSDLPDTRERYTTSNIQHWNYCVYESKKDKPKS